MTKKTCGVYQIRNKITGERYIGSSKNIERRWQQHKWPSKWQEENKKLLYKKFQEYGIENFDFSILEIVEEVMLKQKEQEWINQLKPEYNRIFAYGKDEERQKQTAKNYKKREDYKQKQKIYRKNTDNDKRYKNKICIYNGEELKFHTLATRFYRAGIPTPYVEARKYLK